MTTTVASPKPKFVRFAAAAFICGKNIALYEAGPDYFSAVVETIGGKRLGSSTQRRDLWEGTLSSRGLALRVEEITHGRVRLLND